MTGQVLAGRGSGRVFTQPQRPMYWVYVGLFAFGAFKMGTELSRFAELTPTALLISVLANGVLAFVVIKLINWLDLFGRLSVPLMAAAFGWGAVVATTVAAHANDLLTNVLATLGVTDWGIALAAATNEETLKLLGVVAVAVIGRRHIRRPMDGLVLGMMCGLGFEVVENLLYGVQTAITDVNSDISAAIVTNGARLVLGVGGHVMYTGIAGLGVGYFLTRQDRPAATRFAVAVGTFALAWVLHFLWDAPIGDGVSLGALVKYLVQLVAFFLLYRFAARWDWASFTATMSEQPSTVITSDELASMRTLTRRRRARSRARKEAGRAAGKRLRRLQEFQLGYAIALNHSSEPQHDPAVRTRWEDINEIRAEDHHQRV
ncbi:PrsW family intramembrane metalloprotease [Stackebrandtia nassauensis]|uniref:Membrane protein-like protein n=1 Tax=Stackebrandtia nassauensis (strain DSM 44728 / CIP 108903 / NRRL B-16338 / NBRC 102104 / LLR-40K-21) TaxID=446470 RepID=D3PW69_STANL|nr:PrsW family intramembrane metalloprotease [Stackebrandtia nassauensis]ADD41226.1 membrane protein-like protein [Stackebrandtia nassauensis DSM 44728]